jgi:hypothetical protein
MKNFRSTRKILGWTLTAALAIATAGTVYALQNHSLALASSKVTIIGSSNIHKWNAASTKVLIKNAKLAVNLTDAGFLTAIVKPGALQAFEISVPVLTLKSDKDGLDKNMYKALKADKHADITFRATRLVPGTVEGTMRATGILTIVGVAKEVTFDINAQMNGALLTIKGSVPILMTDYGIEPPKAMLGMVKADPKVTVTFEAVLTVPPATFHN